LLTDSIRVCNQYLVGLSAFISSLTYYRMGRLVMPLGLCLAGGGILGAYLIPVLTAGKINLSSYIGYFGIVVFAVAFVLFYETTPAGQAKKKAAKAAAKAFEDINIRKCAVDEGGAHACGVRVTHWGFPKIYNLFLTIFLILIGIYWIFCLYHWFIRKMRTSFTFYGVEFSFNPFWPIMGGFVIAAISAFIGVGGGFLYVPFLTSVAGLPMFIVAGTSALAVLVSMITSIFAYMFVKSVPVDFVMIFTELIGIFIGSILGPVTSKYIPDIWLKRIFVVLAVYVGLGYLTKGFLGHSIMPGM
ncbi:MAG: hypothetical protein A2139_08450, partial [Desulfobacca sp. RBG_16_60_12]